MILIIDDDPVRRATMGEMLTSANRPWLEATSNAVAMDLLSGSVGDNTALALLDLDIDGAAGLTLLREIRRIRPALPVIILADDGSTAGTASAMRSGAQDVLVKPVASAALEIAIRNALKMYDLKQEAMRLTYPSRLRSVPSNVTGFEDLIAESEATKHAIRIALRGADSVIPILIEGESGVGKEVFARAIHASSNRSGKSFVAVNCGALPENLIESILFGHEKGAFTGAVARRTGKFEEADGGVLFLDEIGELPLEAQVKLLRAIQEGEIDPVGGARTIKTNIRLISATNRNLIAEIAAGRFREDLYYRISVFPLTLPPLRARRDDIPRLARFFGHRFAEQEGKRFEGLSDEALTWLTAFNWPGNIRQMENAIHRAVVLATGPVLEVGDFAHLTTAASVRPHPEQAGEGLDMQPSPFFDDAGHIRPFADIEAAVLHAALERYGGSMSEAARRLGIGRSTLYRKTRCESEAAQDRGDAA
jgi:DNA-binding NtrC family response regulator